MKLSSRAAALAALPISATLLLTACEGGADEAADFPTSPVELVNPWAAGGSHDLHVQVIAGEMEELLGQPMNATAREGGGGALGASHVAQATADGYTLLLGDQTSVIARPMVESTDYAAEDLRPVAQINDSPVVLTVPGDSPYDTLEEFLEAATEDPGSLQYVSVPGLGPDQIPVELFIEEEGLDLDHVPVGGGGDVHRALLAGDSDMGPLFPAAVQQDVEEGTLKALAVTGSERLDSLPDVPTLGEKGIDVEYEMFRTVFAPADTPDDVVDTLAGAFEELSNDQEFVELIEDIGEEVEFLAGEELNERFQSDIDAIDAIVGE